MIGIVVAAHDHLADALLSAACSVLGQRSNLISISIDPRDGAPEIQRKFQEAVERVRSPAGVLILTDMFGGTPANIGLTLHEAGKVELLTGVNLPMLIKAAQLSTGELPLTRVAKTVAESGVKSITVAGALLGPGATEGTHG